MPGPRADWIGQVENDWDDLIPVADKRTKAAKVKGQERAVFKLFSLGVVTNRDDWVSDLKEKSLSCKVAFLLSEYQAAQDHLMEKDFQDEKLDVQIKWTRHLKHLLRTGVALDYDSRQIRRSSFRPFFDKVLYYGSELNEFLYQNDQAFYYC